MPSLCLFSFILDLWILLLYWWHYVPPWRLAWLCSPPSHLWVCLSQPCRQLASHFRKLQVKPKVYPPFKVIQSFYSKLLQVPWEALLGRIMSSEVPVPWLGAGADATRQLKGTLLTCKIEPTAPLQNRLLEQPTCMCVFQKHTPDSITTSPTTAPLRCAPNLVRSREPIVLAPGEESGSSAPHPISWNRSNNFWRATEVASTRLGHSAPRSDPDASLDTERTNKKKQTRSSWNTGHWSFKIGRIHHFLTSWSCRVAWICWVASTFISTNTLWRIVRNKPSGTNLHKDRGRPVRLHWHLWDVNWQLEMSRGVKSGQHLWRWFELSGASCSNIHVMVFLLGTVHKGELGHVEYSIC